MTLRIRLIVAFTVLLLVVVAIVGIVAVRTTRGVLIDQIDERHRDRAQPDRSGRSSSTKARPRVAPIDSWPRWCWDQMARSSQPPLPACKATRIHCPDTNSLVQLPAPSSEDHHRSGVQRRFPIPGGSGSHRRRIHRDIRPTIARGGEQRLGPLPGVYFLRAVSSWSSGAAAVWYTVRLGMRPVDQMIQTASAIAEGDLTRRVPPADPESELGQLGTALNHMLASLEGAFQAETRANETLKQFVADASHELRTPLAAIAGYTELFRNGALTDPTDTAHAIRRIGAESKRMKSLVDDLLLSGPPRPGSEARARSR